MLFGLVNHIFLFFLDSRAVDKDYATKI